jgi:hypothetical protein
MKKNHKRASVATRLIQGLQEFIDELKKKQPIAKKFTCRVTKLDIRSPGKRHV